MYMQCHILIIPYHPKRSEMNLYKVWDQTRQKKCLIPLKNEDENYFELILKASAKLELDGSILVLESDGTIIDDDIVLKLIKHEKLLLLEKNQEWISADKFDLATCSTDSYSSSLLENASETSCTSSYYTNSENIGDHSGDSLLLKPITEFTWEEFEVPYEKLNSKTIQDCQNGKRSKDTMNDVVHLAVSAVRNIKAYVPCKVFKIIARKIVQKYPKMFQDVDEDGIVVGDGSSTLYYKLMDRNNYLNRPHKTKGSLLHDLKISPKQRKLTNSKKAGCSNWQPEENEVPPETLAEKKMFLFNAVQDKNYLFTDQISCALQETYAQQRFFINKETPTINLIKNEWPILLKKEGIFHHFNQLMNMDINLLGQNLLLKHEKILKYGYAKKFINKNEVNDLDKKLLLCFEVLGRCFNENNNDLIKKVNKIENIENYIIEAPCILITGNTLTYSIYMEKEKIEEVNDFITSLKLLFALYFNLNVAYPVGNGCTLEFIQIYLMKINPDQGTKNKKKKSFKQKIISVISALRDI